MSSINAQNIAPFLTWSADGSGVLSLQSNGTTAANVTASGINMVGAVTMNDGTQFNSANSLGMRNRIINGAMLVDQRSSGTLTNQGFPADRWQYATNVASKLSVAKNLNSITPPQGFANCIGIQSSSSYSSGANEYFGLYQPIEGLNLIDLALGSATGSYITVSFWTRSSLTGTFNIALSSQYGANATYSATYTINNANTWEQKTITIPPTALGTWAKDNTLGMMMWFDLGSGSTYQGTGNTWSTGYVLRATGTQSIVGTNASTFYVTGVQLERGTVATPFEQRPYGTELALCQRYYYKSYNQSTAPGTASAQPTNTAWVVDTGALNRIFFVSGAKFAVAMRTAPSTVAYYSEDGTSNNVSVYNNSASKLAISSTPTPTDGNLSEYLQLSSNATAGLPYVFSFTASAEL